MNPSSIGSDLGDFESALSFIYGLLAFHLNVFVQGYQFHHLSVGMVGMISLVMWLDELILFCGDSTCSIVYVFLLLDCGFTYVT